MRMCVCLFVCLFCVVLASVGRLEDAGHGVGVRLLELLIHREKANKREIRLISILSFIHSTVWRTLFGKTADSLEKVPLLCLQYNTRHR